MTAQKSLDTSHCS